MSTDIDPFFMDIEEGSPMMQSFLDGAAWALGQPPQEEGESNEDYQSRIEGLLKPMDTYSRWINE